MKTEIHCPKCGAELELTGLVRSQLETEVRENVRTEVDARLREKEAELVAARERLSAAADVEADLLRKQRALEETQKTAERDVERRIATEVQRVREDAANAARERYEREASERAQTATVEIEELRGKLADAAAVQAAFLKKEREVDERARQLDLDIERRIAEEAAKIRLAEAKAADERITRQVEERVRITDAELAMARKKLADSAANEAAITKQRRELEERERQLAVDLELRVAQEAKRIRDQEAKLAEQRWSLTLEERVRTKDSELTEIREKLGAATQRETDLLRKERELIDRAREIELDVERKVAEEARRLREQSAKAAEEHAAIEAERQRLVEEEHRQQLDGMRKSIADLQRRAQQGSQQAQGEAQEVLLRDILLEAFSDDEIADVPKGVFGADAVQRVRGPGQRDCGTIVWESKRTKAWSDDWLTKVRDDQRLVGGACAVIVTQVMPANTRHFGVVGDVWVCAWPFAAALGAALRAGLVEVALARRTAEGRGEKMQMLYEYLTGTEFRNRVGGFVEAFKEMQDELEGEKRAMLTRWKRRERLMQRARDNITAFYGDLQGIAGRQLQDLPPLALDPTRALPAAEADMAEQAGDEELRELLFMLVPEDGSNVGNTSLCERFIEKALADLGVLVTTVDYERCKGTLLTDGRLRRAKGKGGSVCRR